MSNHLPIYICVEEVRFVISKWKMCLLYKLKNGKDLPQNFAKNPFQY